MAEYEHPSIKIDNPGWALIDEATLRLAGDVDVIVREMENVLKDNAVRAMCLHLGILSCGFLFYDKLRELTRFYNDDDPEAAKTYGTEYIWRNQDASRWSDLVHSVFVHVRTTQYKYAKLEKKRTEDYFRNVPKDPRSDSCIASEEQDLRISHSVHYVTLGEMLYTMACWRCLVGGVALFGPDLPLDQLNIAPDLVDPRLATCTWHGVDLLEWHRQKTDVRSNADLCEAWESLYANTPSLQREWDLIGIRREGTLDTMEGYSLRRFAASIGALDRDLCDSSFTDSDLATAIQSTVPILLKSLGAPSGVATIGDALKAIEVYARFPILPFYLWHALDGAPKCYLVSPVWTSQQHGVLVGDILCRHLGLALCAVAPLRLIDWTLPKQTSFDLTILTSDADPTVLANVLRLMARPLVEGLLYSKVVEALNEHIANAIEKQVADEVQKLC